WITLGTMVVIGAALWSRKPRARLVAIIAGLLLLCYCGSGVLFMLGSLAGIGRRLPETGLPRQATPAAGLDLTATLGKVGIRPAVGVSGLRWWKLRVNRVLPKDRGAAGRHRLPAFNNERVRGRVPRLSRARGATSPCTPIPARSSVPARSRRAGRCRCSC